MARAVRGAAPSPKAPTSTGGGGSAPSAFRRGRDVAGSGFDAVKTRKGTAVHETAGFIVGVVVWCWVVLPFLSGGPTAVKNVLRAKFVNEGPDGKQL